MREKTEKCVVTFRTTTGAMAMERLCREQGVPGRLIPVPRSITAGCGMCWAAPREAREAVEDLVVKEHLDVDGIYAIIL
ncbi:MAG: DUF3343 domain-containing protein [Clostridiales bacterium]|nr:DUF3343 domain-containing protein [Clostridiales bacterium]MCI7713412.1 DUF3343 domain-containing protein [Clostridiales bacterium]MDY3690512.1 DUF3343 domain-containing protein [Dysosmobacter sp.]